MHEVDLESDIRGLTELKSYLFLLESKKHQKYRVEEAAKVTCQPIARRLGQPHKHHFTVDYVRPAKRSEERRFAHS